jgi:iron-sulfur cluster assembly protein
MMLVLTTSAADAIVRILSPSAVPATAGVRITASSDNGPVQLAPSHLRVALVDAPDETDEVIEDSTARVFVQQDVASYLTDKTLDAQISGNEVRFSVASQD